MSSKSGPGGAVMPTVSVIMPAYNVKEYLEESVRSVVDQTFQAWELVVVDDASSDETPDILQKFAGEDHRIVVDRLAADGLEAMKVLLNATVDVVITDAMMPNLSGYELCRFVRGSQSLSQMPIILLSALDRKDAEPEAGQADAFLSKPISPENLLDCLEALLVCAEC